MNVASAPPLQEDEGKIDPITALQDGIDGLSLAMFEALRGLRDAVAPESGNLGSSNNTNNNNPGTEQQPDMDELWHAYKVGDADVVRMVQQQQQAANQQPSRITSREEFVRWHAKMEMEKDTELVMKLARTVLEKSAAIDQQVDESIPGMHRTRTEQMEYLEELIAANRTAARELQQAYELAKQKRDACRQFIIDKTCEALDIEEDSDFTMK